MYWPRNKTGGVIKLAHKRILSPTAINSYLSCPRKFYLRYIKKLKTKPSIHLIRGSVVHTVLERFAREHESLPGNQASVQLLRLFDEEWKKVALQLATLNMKAEELFAFEQESRLMLINFYFWLRRHQQWPPRRIEMRLVSKKLGLMGIVDALHDTEKGPVVVDYKTSAKAEITPDVKRQAALYALLHQDFFGKPLKAVCIHFLKFDADPLVIPVDQGLMEYGRLVTEEVHRVTQTDAKADYPCTCGGWCEKDFIKK